jgi:hypothetical protein
LPDAIRLTMEDGRSLTIERPLIRFDQTIQSEFGGPSAALQNISAVEARRFNAIRTFSFLVAHTSALLHIISVIVDAQPHYRGVF